jgi:hypothetical protein
MTTGPLADSTIGVTADRSATPLGRGMTPRVTGS